MLAHTHPVRQRRQIGGIRFCRLFVLPLPIPFLAPFGEDAFEKLGAGFVGAAFLAGEFGFGGDEFAFAGGFEDGGAVAFEVGLHPPQARDSRLQPRELLLDLRHDLALFVNGGAESESSNRTNTGISRLLNRRPALRVQVVQRCHVRSFESKRRSMR